jgi:structural maintenance of chromosomes protein 6
MIHSSVSLQNDEKQMHTSLQGVKASMADYEARIAEEARRMEAHTQAKREETMRKLENARAEVDLADAQVKEIVARDEAKRADNEAIKEKGTQEETIKTRAEQRIVEIQEMMKQCKKQQDNAFIPYGKNIKELVEQIGKLQWHGEKPLGPLGLYVQVKEPELWAADLLRSQLVQYLTAFAITDARDRPQLKRLLDQSKK